MRTFNAFYRFCAKTEQRLATAMLLLAALLWGVGNVANKTILDDVNPFAAVVLRNLIACTALLPLVLREKPNLTNRAWLRSTLVASILFAIATIIQQMGYETATVTNASFLVNASCVFTPLLAFVLFREHLSPQTVLAALLMLVGALFMSGAATSLAAVNLGDLLCLLSALFYGIWIFWLGRHSATYGLPATTTLMQCLCAAIVAAPFAGLGSASIQQDWWGALPEGLYLGIFSSAAAFALMAAAQSSVSASTAAVLVSAESLFGAAGGILLLGERPTPIAILGALLMIAAIALVSLAPERRPALP